MSPCLLGPGCQQGAPQGGNFMLMEWLSGTRELQNLRRWREQMRMNMLGLLMDERRVKHLSPSPRLEFLSLSHSTSISSRRIRSCGKNHFGSSLDALCWQWWVGPVERKAELKGPPKVSTGALSTQGGDGSSWDPHPLDFVFLQSVHVPGPGYSPLSSGDGL